MAGINLVKTLTTKYAQLSGEREFADRMAEDAVGLDAIIEVTNRIDARKKDLDEKLAAIETVIWLFDPKWDPAKVHPRAPRKRHQKLGLIAKTAYSILRDSPIPLTVREVARMAASRLNIENPDGREITRLSSAIQNDFAAREGRTLMIASYNPSRWAVIPREQARAGINRSQPERGLRGNVLRLPPVRRERAS